ncbi:MAG TPA: hypothetical protein VKQ05_05710 [Gemmatimonadales bacterium]|nr:hypothetical protein [Gemmatimonadales bacterium]
MFSRSLFPPRDAFELIDRAFVLARRQYWALARLGFIPFLAGTTLIYAFSPRPSLLGRYLYSGRAIYASFGA